jgi:hypothetical protein
MYYVIYNSNSLLLHFLFNDCGMVAFHVGKHKAHSTRDWLGFASFSLNEGDKFSCRYFRSVHVALVAIMIMVDEGMFDCFVRSPSNSHSQSV